MKLEDIRKFNASVREAVEQEKIPGAVLLCGHREETLFLEAHGWAQVVPTRDKMTVDTSFDMASCTKLMATWAVTMTLLQKGVFTLDMKLPELLHRPMNEKLKDVTLYDLMTHTAGIQPDMHTSYEYGPTRRERVDGLLSLTPPKPIGGQVQYSCVGFIYLGEACAEATGKPLNEAAADVYRQLGMEHTGYLPPKGTYCAATEWRPGWAAPQRGEVHDEGSAQLGGVAGNAGLFSTAEDAGKFCAAVLPGNKAGLFEDEWLKKTYKNYTRPLGENRGLGWCVYVERESGLNIIGHTGFTGTRIWIDTLNGDYCVLLTNRVHPSRANGNLPAITGPGFETLFGVPME